MGENGRRDKAVGKDESKIGVRIVEKQYRKGKRKTRWEVRE